MSPNLKASHPSDNYLHIICGSKKFLDICLFPTQKTQSLVTFSGYQKLVENLFNIMLILLNIKSTRKTVNNVIV